MLETHRSLQNCTISDRYLEVSLSLPSKRLFLHLSPYFCFPPCPSLSLCCLARCRVGAEWGCQVINQRLRWWTGALGDFGQRRTQEMGGCGRPSPKPSWMGCPWLFRLWGGEWSWTLKVIRLCPEAAGCSFRCMVPRKSQEVIKWKRSENEEVLVRSLALLGMEPQCPGRAVSRECPRRSGAHLIYSSELGALLPSVCKWDWSPGGF